jgi:uncharacterized membrane protein YphA (DoxX/SURF4 family)
MPFFLIADDALAKPDWRDVGLFFVRVLAILSFTYYQLVEQLRLAFDWLWTRAPWDLLDQITQSGHPFPPVLAVSLIVLLALTCFAIFFGIFARWHGLVFFLLCLYVLVAPLELSPTLNPQTVALYTILGFGFIFSGAGRLSLDNLWRKSLRRKPR